MACELVPLNRRAFVRCFILYALILVLTNRNGSFDDDHLALCEANDVFVTECSQLRGSQRLHMWHVSDSGHLGFFFKRKFFGKRVPYCAFHTAQFNISLIIAHGDIHPHPGPRNNVSNAVNTSQRRVPTSTTSDHLNIHSLSVFYTNARSIVNKRNQLNLELASKSYDIVILTETHLDHTIADGEIFPRGYTVFRRDREHHGRHGGGVLIATRDSVRAFPRDDLHVDTSELFFVELVLSNKKKLTLRVFYRLPNNDLKPLEDLKLALNQISPTELILVGDFNLSAIDWNIPRVLDNSSKYELLLDTVQDHFLTQLVTSPTRENNILDLVFASSPDIVENVSVGAPFSDHNSITFSILGSPYEKRDSQKLCYSYVKADWVKLRELLQRVPWHCAFLDDDIDSNWTAWSDLLFSSIDECIPKRKKLVRRHAPWLTNDLIKLCRRKKSLYRKAKRWGRDNDWFEYRALNNSLKKACNSARRQYVYNIAQDLKTNGNPKSFWSYVKAARKGTNDLVALKVGSSTLTDDLDIAESMNSYFSSVFTSECFTNFPGFSKVVDSNLSSIVCNANEVTHILKNLNAYKSPGPDHLPPRVDRKSVV